MCNTFSTNTSAVQGRLQPLEAAHSRAPPRSVLHRLLGVAYRPHRLSRCVTADAQGSPARSAGRAALPARCRAPFWPTEGSLLLIAACRYQFSVAHAQPTLLPTRRRRRRLHRLLLLAGSASLLLGCVLPLPSLRRPACRVEEGGAAEVAGAGGAAARRSRWHAMMRAK